MKTVYAYHPETGVFLGTTEADESPLEPGVFLLPAFSTEQKPPRARRGHTPHFDERAGRWVNRRDPEPEPPQPEPETEIDLAAQARAKRNALLAESDWTQLYDAPFNDEQLTEWRRYRRELRDVPQQPDFPETINWPEKP